MQPSFLHRSRTFVLILCIALSITLIISSCMLLGGGSSGSSSSGSSSSAENSALVQQLLNEFKSNLSNTTTRLVTSEFSRSTSKLSSSQAETLAQGALDALKTGGYNDSEDLTYILPLILQGAQKSLSAFSDSDKKTMLSVTAPSVLKTLSGRSSVLATSTVKTGLTPLQSVLQGLATQSIATLDETGVSQNTIPEYSALAMQALLGGLGEGGIAQADLQSSVSVIVSGAISSLGSINGVSTSSMGEIVQQITTGSIIGIGNIVVPEYTLTGLASLAKEVGSAAVSGLSNISLSGYGANSLSTNVKKVAYGGIAALGKISMEGYDSTQLPAMGRNFSSGATSALDEISITGYSSSHLTSSLRSLASGTLAAVSQIQITGYDSSSPLPLVTQISAGVLNEISSLSMSGLSQTSLSSAVAEGSNEGLRESGLSGSITAQDLDYSTPTISSITPSSSATNVSTTSTVSVTFSKVMLASSINSQSFQLQVNDFPIPGSIAVSGNSATFTPSGNLPSSTTLKIVLSTGVTDLFGNPIVQKTVSFTTLQQGITVSGHLYGNVRDALVIADKVSTGTVGNAEVDAGEAATPSSTSGSFSSLYLNYGNYVLTTPVNTPGSKTKPSGSSVAAMPMLAPGAIFGSNTIEVSPLTTLSIHQPKLLAKLDAAGGWNVDLSRSSGVQGKLLRVSKMTEFVWDIISKGNTPLVKEKTQQQKLLPLLAQILYLEGSLGSEVTLSNTAEKTISHVLNSTDMVAQDRFKQSEKASIISIVKSGITDLTQTIPDSVIVESQILASLEQKTNAALETILKLTDTESPSLTLNFPPTIQSMKAVRSATNVLIVSAVVVDDTPAQLKYRWTLSGASFVDSKSNPAIVQNYSDSMSGTLTVFVQDQSGLEFSRSLELVQGAYPL